jgi:hypothetical protein
MTTQPRRKNGRKALRLAYWDADGVCGKELELDQFLSEHCVDICLLNETYLESGRAFRFTNYVCHRTDPQARGGGTAILDRRDIDHYAVPVSGLRHPEATAIHLVLANRLVKIVAAYLLPTRLLTESDLNECLSGDLCLDGGRSQRKAHGLEFSFDHDHGRAPA